MEPTVSAMTTLLADLGTVVTNVWSVITTSLTNITQDATLTLFVILVPVLSIGIGVFGRILRIGRY